jgi:hypothetical protein
VTIKELIVVLEKNYEYFKAHLPELLERYYNKYIVIKDNQVIGAYDTFDDAFDGTSGTEEKGTFIIQHCVEEDKAPTVHFAWNNVVFPQVSV